VAFDALLKEAETADAVLVTHLGHTGERARGDSRFRDWPDVEWRLVRQDDQPGSPRFLSAYGRDVDVPESQLAYDPQTRRLTLLGGSRNDLKFMAALDAVVSLLEGSPGLTRRNLTAALMEQGDYPNAARHTRASGVNGYSGRGNAHEQGVPR
jgi:hypothetical protein